METRWPNPPRRRPGPPLSVRISFSRTSMGTATSNSSTGTALMCFSAFQRASEMGGTMSSLAAPQEGPTRPRDGAAKGRPEGSHNDLALAPWSDPMNGGRSKPVLGRSELGARRPG